MARTRFEEAKLCGICGEPGEEGGYQMLKVDQFSPAVRVVQIYCRNERCTDYNKVSKLIQLNADGSMPEPTMDPIKKYEPLKHDIDKMRESIVANHEAEMREGELRGWR
jgi:hypothetical protein